MKMIVAVIVATLIVLAGIAVQSAPVSNSSTVSYCYCSCSPTPTWQEPNITYVTFTTSVSGFGSTTVVIPITQTPTTTTPLPTPTTYLLPPKYPSCFNIYCQVEFGSCPMGWFAEGSIVDPSIAFPFLTATFTTPTGWWPYTQTIYQYRNSDDNSSKTVAIVLGVVGSVAAVTIVVSIFVFLYHQNKLKIEARAKGINPEMLGPTSTNGTISTQATVLVPQPQYVTAPQYVRASTVYATAPPASSINPTYQVGGGGPLVTKPVQAASATYAAIPAATPATPAIPASTAAIAASPAIPTSSDSAAAALPTVEEIMAAAAPSSPSVKGKESMEGPKASKDYFAKDEDTAKGGSASA